MLKQGKEPIDIPRRQPIDIPHKHVSVEEGPSGLPWGWIVLGLIVLAAVAFFLFPAIKGYRTYAAMHDYGVPDQYVSDLQGLADANMVCAQQLNETSRERDACVTDYATCTVDLNAQKALVESLGSDLSQRGSELSSCELASAEKDSAIADAARRICCIQRVENSAINGYAVLDGKISCVTEGGESITC